MTDKTERQRLIDSFVNAIYLYDDKLVITFNYKDGTKTISLDEVNGSDLTGHGVPNLADFCLEQSFLTLKAKAISINTV